MNNPIHEIVLGGFATLLLVCGLVWFTSSEDPCPTPNPIHKRLVYVDASDMEW